MHAELEGLKSVGFFAEWATVVKGRVGQQDRIRGARIGTVWSTAPILVTRARISLASSFIFLYANDEALAVCNVSQQVLVGPILMQIRRVLMTIK